MIDPISTDPISFTCSSQQDEVQQTTRASVLLTSDFMVSTYKAFAQTKQQTVMENYHVEYKTTGTAWDGNQRPYWDYTQVSGQYEKFWDYSNFPYRFHAIAPFPTNTTGFVLSDKSLSIPTPYSAQTCHNGMITPTNTVAEPHLVAQVQRNRDGKDYDLLTNDPETLVASPTEITNNIGSLALNRYVALPFHHLNSKIRFGVYHSTQWLTANKTYIEHLTISVTSPQFVTQASGYQASITPGNSGNSGLPTGSWYIGTGNSGFTDPKSVASATSSPYPIFRFDGGEEVADNDLAEHQTRQTAFWLQCKDGIMQLPQENVQMIVSFDLMNADGSLKQSFTNVPVRLEIPADNETDPPTYDYDFDWRSGYIYTYYLVIGEIEDKLEITFTATLTPWEDVTGSLTTDLEQ